MKKRHNKDKWEYQENVPEIFKDLWGFNFVEEVSFTKIKNEIWPKIRIMIARENENKIETIKTLLQKYEFPFSNLKIIISGDKKDSETNATGSSPSLMSKMSKPAGKGNVKPGTISGRRLPPFRCA